MHPRSGIQSLYDDGGKELVRMEQFHIPARRHWIPDPHFSAVVESFDHKQRLTKWQWGDLTKSVSIDSMGRINKVDFDNIELTSYEYTAGSIFPSTIRNGEAITFQLKHDRHGALREVILPSKHVHRFKLIPLIGSFVFEHFPPWSTSNSTKTVYDGSNNQLIRTIYPDGSHISMEDIKVNGMDSNLYVTRVKDKIEEIVLETEGDRSFRSTVHWSCTDLYCYDYNFNCSVYDSKTKKQITSNQFSIGSDVITKRMIRANDFVYERSSTSTLVRGMFGPGSLYLSELDSMGRTKTKTLLIGGNLALHESVNFGKRNTLAKRRQTLPGKTLTKSFEYSSNGHLMKQTSDSVIWQYNYDPNGNVVNADYGVGNTSLEIEFGCRVGKVAGKYPVTYDVRGNLVGRHNYTFIYSDLDLLIEVKRKNKPMTKFAYDDRKRVVLMIKTLDEEEETFHYFYGFKERTDLISHVYWSKFGFYSMIYDEAGLLIALQTPNMETLLVITDENGTPEIVFDKEAIIVNSFSRSPFGALIREENDMVWIPIGYHGGVEDVISGIVVINGRAYDSHLGQWMTPGKMTTIKNVEDLNRVYPYRFRNNDPVNPDSLKTIRLMISFEDWLSFYGIKSPLKHLSVLEEQRDIQSLFSSVQVEQDFEFVDSRIAPNICSGFSTEAQILGPNVKIKMDHKTSEISSTPQQGAGSFERVLSELLNGTVILGDEEKDPTSLHFYLPIEKVVSDLGALKNAAANVEENFVTSKSYRLGLGLQRIRLNFWIGFGSLKEAADSKRLYDYVMYH